MKKSVKYEMGYKINNREKYQHILEDYKVCFGNNRVLHEGEFDEHSIIVWGLSIGCLELAIMAITKIFL